MQELNQPFTSIDRSVSMLVTFKVKPEMSDIFKQALLDDLIQSRQESGYVSMELFAATDNPHTLFLLERWQNQLALDHHFAQPYTQAVLALTATCLISPLEIHHLEALDPLVQQNSR